MCVQFSYDVVDGLVYVELFAAEYVDEGSVPIGECVNADVAFCDYDESAYSPLGRVLTGTVDERVWWSDLVHPDNVGKLV